MSFDWNSGQKKSTGFDWDSGNPGEIVLPTLPKPKVDVKEEYVPTLARYANEAFAKPAASVAKGYYEGAASGAHLLGNAAKGVENITGLKRGGAFDYAEQYYRDRAKELDGRGASGVAGSLYEAAGRTPADLAKYTVATTALGGPAGMAAVDALEASDKGAKESAIAGIKGAMMGGLLHVTAPATMPTRVAAMGTAGAAETAIAGGSPTDIISSGLTMGGMAVPGGKGTSFREARAAEAKAATDYARMKDTQAARQADELPQISEPKVVGINDRQNTSGLSSQERVGQEPVQADALQGGSGEAAGASGVLQAPGRSGLREVVTTGIRPTRLRSAGQGGALMIGKPPAPLSPTDQYISDVVAKRDAERVGPVRERLDRFKAAVAKLKSEGVDSLSPIIDAFEDAQKKYGFKVRPRDDFRYLADRAIGSRDIAEVFMDQNGLPDIIREPTTEKVRNPVNGKVIDGYTRFNQYLIAKEALRESKSQKRETGRDLVADQSVVDDLANKPVDPSRTNSPTFEQLAQKVYQYRDKVLDYSVDSGIISKEMAANWRQQYGGEGVPLARVFDELESASQAHPAKGRQVASLGKQTAYQKRVGSSRSIEDPVYELVERTMKVFADGERNKAARSLAEASRLPGMDHLIWEVTDPGAGPLPKNHISYLDNGKRRVFGVTPEIEAAAKSLDARNLGIAAKIIGYPARVTRFFTTGVRPAFAAANVPVDIMTTLVTSDNVRKTTLNPATFWKALVAVTTQNDAWRRIQSEGAGFSQLDLIRGNRDKTVDAIRAGRSAKDRGRYVAAHPIRSIVEAARAAEDLVSRSEQFGRARIFMGTEKASLEKGYHPEDAKALATIASNNELPNYRHSGDVTRAFAGAVLYFNAKVQGARNILRVMEDRPIESASRIIATVALPTALITAYNLSDPDRKKIYDDIREYEKENNFVLVAPGARLNPKTNKYEGVLKIKLDPGLNNIATLVRHYIESFQGSDPVTFGEVAEKLVGTVSPVDPTVRGVMSGGMPQLFKPSVQGAANYDFYRGGPKVPKSLQDLPKSQQVLPNTSGTIRRLASSIGTSPVGTEEFIKDTLGGSSPEIINAVDTVANKAGLIGKDEVGGQSVIQSITSRFDEARAGQGTQKEYELLDKIRKRAAEVAVARTKSDPRYAAIADEKSRLEVDRKAASRALARVNSLTVASKRWDSATHEQRMAALKRLEQMVSGSSATSQFK